MKKKIHKVLLDMNFNPSLRGFNYLTEAIIMAQKSENILSAEYIIDVLSEKYHYSKGSINGSLRNSYNNCDKQMRNNISNVIDILEDNNADYIQKGNAIRSIAKKMVYIKEFQTLIIYYYIAV